MSEESVTYRGDKHCLSFNVNKDVMLHGLRLLGSENNQYTVNLEVKDCNYYPLMVMVSKSGTFTAKVFQYKSFPIHGFDVLFDSPVHLKKRTTYKLEALISGPPSLKGTDG